MLKVNPKTSFAKMILKTSAVAFAGILSAATFFGCSNDSGKVAGGTEAESTIASTVALQIQLADGSPAAAARVRMLPDSYMAAADSVVDWSVADEEGYIEFNDVEPGSYTIEARRTGDGEALGAITYLTYDSEGTSVSDSVKLDTLTYIEGFVAKDQGPVVLRIAGLDRYIEPDERGYFVIDSIPAGSYEIVVESLDDHEMSTVSTQSGDTLLLADSTVFQKQDTSVFSKNWKDHDALIASVDGYAVGVRGGAGPVGESGNVGEICVVTTTNDYLIIEDTTFVDDTTMTVTTNAVVAPGSLRECATKDTSVWIVFEKSGAYNLQSPLRITSNKTIDGRGRDIRITGMGILTNENSNLIFENIKFVDPAITVQDTTSRRALSIHNLTSYVWVDHCTFEEYPLIELDVKRGSSHVTVSWSRFENAQTGILFGMPADVFVDTAQTFTMHHNYFANMSYSGVYARGGMLHAYNNVFADLRYAAVECSDSASCLIENNVFDTEVPVSLYRLYNVEDGSPVAETLGFAKITGSWFAGAGSDEFDDANGYVPDYTYEIDFADVALARIVKDRSGTR